MKLNLQYNPIASIEELKQTKEIILNLPLQTKEGLVFQYDAKSREAIRTLVNNEYTGKLDWVLADNSTVPCTHKELTAYYLQLEKLTAMRLRRVDTTYRLLKQNGVTKRELLDWRKTYEY